MQERAALLSAERRSAILELLAREGKVVAARLVEDLGVSEQQLTKVAATVTEHPLLANTPQSPDSAELLELLREAL